MRRIILIFCLFTLAGAVNAQEDVSGVQRAIDGYVEAKGGIRSLMLLSSIRVEGVQIQEDEVFDFILHKKRPWSFRYRISRGSTLMVVCGYNGRTGWQRTDVGGETEIEVLSGARLLALRDEARFESPLLRSLRDRSIKIFHSGTDRIDGVTVEVLEVHEVNHPRTRYFISAQSGHLLKRERMNGDGTVGLISYYRNYRRVDGYLFAFEVENRLGDATVALIQIKTIETNPGLLSFYFEKPRG